MRLALLALILPGLALAEPDRLRNDLPSAIPDEVAAIETGVPAFPTCGDYLAAYPEVRRSPAVQPQRFVSCEIGFLLGIGEPLQTERPTACRVLDGSIQNMDLRSFPNGSAPRLPQGTDPVTLDKLYDVDWTVFCSAAMARDQFWVISIAPLAVGDWTDDGKPDALVVYEEQARDGSFYDVYALVLTGLEGEAVTALPLCVFLPGEDDGVGDACDPD
ncbi:hypothetical protein AAD018_005345 [Aestuariibius insulae]|uniref:hypothetical protein n=1 Tax=Aestuariibius insulae TaxID=2058287 RepID=UPI00345F0A35